LERIKEQLKYTKQHQTKSQAIGDRPLFNIDTMLINHFKSWSVPECSSAEKGTDLFYADK
jgi:hypothetical protein